MAYEHILQAIETELNTLQNVRAMLSSSPDVLTTLPSLSKRGRKPGLKNKPKVEPVETAAPKKRTMSAEGRAKIAEAQRERHANHKRTAKKEARLAAQAESTE